MDKLSVADTGMTENYQTINSTCNNKQQAVHPLPIQMPNGEIITSLHTKLLSHQDLPLQLQKSPLFPGINKALLSNGKLCNHECEATLNDKYVRILSKQSGKIIMKGTRYPCTNLYMLNLTQQNKTMMESTTHDEYFAGSAYGCRSNITLVDYQRASCFSPTQLELVK